MTTKAATPAASSSVDKVLADVAGFTEAVVEMGVWPKTDLVTMVFIFCSLSSGFDTLNIKDYQNHVRILGLLLVLFNFIFMMCIIHISDELSHRP
jgi:hypothetical protein